MNYKKLLFLMIWPSVFIASDAIDNMSSEATDAASSSAKSTALRARTRVVTFAIDNMSSEAADAGSSSTKSIAPRARSKVVSPSKLNQSNVTDDDVQILKLLMSRMNALKEVVASRCDSIDNRLDTIERKLSESQDKDKQHKALTDTTQSSIEKK